MNDANGSGGSAVVMHCAAAKDVMRKLMVMGKKSSQKTGKGTIVV